MKKFIYLIVLALILGLVLTGCLLSNVGQVPTSEQNGVAYLTKNPDPDPNLVGLWHFDEGSEAPTVKDSVNGNDGTVYGAKTGVPGKFGNALSFDGSNDYVDCGNKTDFEFSGDFSVEVWVRHSAITNQVYVSKWTGSGSPSQWWLGFYSGKACFGVYDGTAGANLVWGTNIADGNWHHVVGVRSGTDMYIYQDSVQIGSATSAIGTAGENVASLTIGNFRGTYWPSGWWWFNGLIDEVRIWNRDLTYAEITYNYNNSLKNVEIDIKPGSDPNSINLGSNGVVPVAILGSADFDAATVNPLTVTLAGAGVKLKGNSGNAGSLEDVNGDVYPDLVVQVYTENLGLATGDVYAVLNAYTYTGLTFLTGSDVIRIVPPK